MAEVLELFFSAKEGSLYLAGIIQVSVGIELFPDPVSLHTIINKGVVFVDACGAV